MATVMTDDNVIDILAGLIIEGFIDRDFSVATAWDEPTWGAQVIYADCADQIQGVPNGAYGFEWNKYGQTLWYHFPDREQADEWFDGVAIDDRPGQW